jgi:3,4-dihydroxy 2-butanone 4-phosphate synthase/GTP cyclohydrolase II
MDTVQEAIEEIRRGNLVIVVDDEDRENEGDLTVAAELVTPDKINFMARHGRGLICLAMTGERLDYLQLPPMVDQNTSKFGTAFTASIDARQAVTTGISAADRARTILTAIDSKAVPSDLVRPGHVFPLRARPGGVLERAGQTEAAVDLSRLAGLNAAGVICEVMNEDGTMARLPQLEVFARAHGLKLVSVAGIIAFRLCNETLVRKVAEALLPTAFGEFHVVVFENCIDQENHLALVKGSIDPEHPVLVRVQSQSTMGDVFHCLASNTGEQLHAALSQINNAGAGVVVYLCQEGKGAGLAGQIKSIAPQDGIEDVAGPKTDPRVYGVGAQILRLLGARKIRLLTNHPRKMSALQGYGITVVEQVPLELSRQSAVRSDQEGAFPKNPQEH